MFGSSSGVPSGYENNVTAVFTGVEASPTSAAGLQSTTEVGIPSFTATIASNVSVLFGSLGASTISTASSEGSTPTFISLSPFGGEVGQESASTAVPNVVSIEFSVPTSTLVGGAASLSTVAVVSPLGAGSSTSQTVGGAPTLSPVANLSPLGAGSTTSQNITAAENAGSSATSAIELTGVVGIVPATTVAGVALSPTFSNSSIIIGAIPAGSPASSEIGATIVPSLAAEQSVGSVVTLAVGSSAEQTPAAGQPVASPPIPIIVTNGSTALAVIPSPIVGANGLTSLAVFSTPIAPAAGLTRPAVLLTPIVGANGVTSLAVVATPVIGANGLTSLAIGFETETTPAASQSNGAPTPIEGFVLVQPSAFAPQVSGGIPTQANIAASGVANVVLPSGSAETPESSGSGPGNYSIHVPLSPTTATQFQGSAVRLSLDFGVGLFGLMVFLVLL